MRESVTYQAILEEGRQIGGVAELRKIILIQGKSSSCPPSSRIAERLGAESGIERLVELAKRLVKVKTWDEFFR